jgi:hypothetical protein
MLDRKLAGNRVPRWFHEGFAQVKAVEWTMESLWELSRAAWTRTGIPLTDLRRYFPVTGGRAQLAYAQSQAAVRDLMQDKESWIHLLGLLEAGEPFGAALKRATGRGQADFENHFDSEILPGYRRISLLLTGTPLFGLMALIFLVGAWRRGRRRRLALETASEGPERVRLWIDRRRLR